MLTEEFGAAVGVACCWTADLRGAIERPRGRMASRGQKANMQQLDAQCRPAASGLHALAPPSLLPSGTRRSLGLGLALGLGLGLGSGLGSGQGLVRVRVRVRV